MMILNTVLSIFIVLEFFNLLVLYFKPSAKKANGIGVFNAWNQSNKDPEIHNFIKYLVYWVAGTKLIIVSLLLVILIWAEPTLKIISVVVLALTITSFYWKMFPIIKKMDIGGNILPAGYYKKLSLIIVIITVALSLSALFAYLNLV